MFAWALLLLINQKNKTEKSKQQNHNHGFAAFIIKLFSGKQLKKYWIFVIIIKCRRMQVKSRVAEDYSQTFKESERLWVTLVKDMKIANNIKTVEQLKTELLRSVAELYADIGAEVDSETNNRLKNDSADIINLTLVLARRLGLDYDDVFDCMRAKLQKGIEKNHPIEKHFGDMSELKKRL